MSAMPPMLVGQYNEIVLQLGWLLFFAPAFSAGPLFSLLSCLITVQFDLSQMCEFKRRDKPVGAVDIGIWMNLIENVSYLGFVSSTCIIVVTSDKLQKLAPGWSLAKLVITVFLAEHFLFAIKHLMAVLIEDVPDWIVDESR